MVRSFDPPGPHATGSPHTRGDGPTSSNARGHWSRFSPHAWGWSAFNYIRKTNDIVLPTRVGMVRKSDCEREVQAGSPHTRGDGPTDAIVGETGTQFSPHAWGWSAVSRRHTHAPHVLPTRVGMVRPHAVTRLEQQSSPHTRGDGPLNMKRILTIGMFSPHAWGWSGCAAGRGAGI